MSDESYLMIPFDIITGAFFIMGIVFLVKTLIKVFHRKNECTLKVQAEYVRFVEIADKYGNVKVPVLATEINGIKREIEATDYIHSNLRKGKTYTIYVNPSDYDDICIPSNNSQDKLGIMVGCIFMGISVLMWLFIHVMAAISPEASV
jgi:hypothetical protein